MAAGAREIAAGAAQSSLKRLPRRPAAQSRRVDSHLCSSSLAGGSAPAPVLRNLRLCSGAGQGHFLAMLSLQRVESPGFAVRGKPVRRGEHSPDARHFPGSPICPWPGSTSLYFAPNGLAPALRAEASQVAFALPPASLVVAHRHRRASPEGWKLAPALGAGASQVALRRRRCRAAWMLGPAHAPHPGAYAIRALCHCCFACSLTRHKAIA